MQTRFNLLPILVTTCGVISKIMDQKQHLSFLARFLRWSDKTAGKSISFIAALLFLFMWLIVGFFVGFSNTWLLIITSIATINASLMVFIIQNTQNRKNKALNLKLDGIISAIKEAEKQLIAIEVLEEKELDQIRHSIIKSKMKNE